MRTNNDAPETCIGHEGGSARGEGGSNAKMGGPPAVQRNHTFHLRVVKRGPDKSLSTRTSHTPGTPWNDGRPRCSAVC
jgi:hypothetical protein